MSLSSCEKLWTERWNKAVVLMVLLKICQNNSFQNLGCKFQSFYIYKVSRFSTPDDCLTEVKVDCLVQSNYFPFISYSFYCSLSKTMQRGIYLEARVIATVERKRNTSFRKQEIIVLPFSPIYGASPRVVNDNFVVEVKCPSPKMTILLKDYRIQTEK